MRIISGKYRGKIINAPLKLPVRPTTDFAKTGLFNILSHRVDFEKIKVLDLFSGTGNITYEFISRGVPDILAVDENAGCVKFINETLEKLNAQSAEAIRKDVFRFIPSVKEKFDLIFADPPYDLKQAEQLPELIFKNDLLNENGLFILEHASEKNFSHSAYFIENRKYGHVTFSFFKQKNENNF